MGNIRATATRIAGTFLLSAALFGCDTTNPIVAPDALDENRVTRAEKIAGYQGTGQMLGRSPAVSPLSYDVNQIPFQPGPTNLANVGPVCDDCVMNNVPIGFDFPFYGQFYSTLQISSNGFLRFAPPNNDSGCCSGRPIPVNDNWNNIIAFAWTDLNPSGALGGRLRYETLGQAPNRRFVLHADEVRYFGGTQTNLIQWTILHEGTGVIEIHTQVMTPRVITQGIENASGTEAHFVPGRVATTFSLSNDGVRFAPQQDPPIPVSIHAAYSGDPPQPAGTVSLDDEWLYVEILDPLSYRPMRRGAIPFQSPNDVRIGASWETGVPAESYELLDINNDGVLDIRLRWSLQQLEDAGLLPIGQATLVVWGNDNGQIYRGQTTVTVQPGGTVLYDNGPWITHPGAGAGGANVHMAATNFLASNVRRIGAGPHFRIADRFTVTGGPWNISMIVTRALINDLAVPNWNFFSANIWDGRPGDPGSSIVASTSSASFAWANAYAVFQGDPLGSTNFPIYEIYWNTPGLTLPNGSYWVDWQVDGSNAWAIYTTAPNPASPNNPILVEGVGRQLTTTGWQDLLQGEPGVPFTPGTPFLVIGTSGMSSPVGRSFTRADAGEPLTTAQPSRAVPSTQPHLQRQR